MSDTKPLREAAEHHRNEAQRRRKLAHDRYRQAEKADGAGQNRDAKIWRAMGDAEIEVAARQQAEADRLTTMADVYDEMPEPPPKK